MPDEVKGTPLVTEDMFQEDNSPVFVEPNALDENGEEVNREDEALAVVDDVKVEIPPAPEVQPSVVLPDEPGEFTPSDYSFEVTTYDEEGKNGRTVKVKSIDEWDTLLEKEPNLGSSAAVGRAFRAASRMESGAEREVQDYERKVTAYNEAVEKQEAEVSSINRMSAEINYLATKGDLPPVAPQYENANWSDPNVAKQPGIKERIELLAYMRNENNTRQKAGLAPMTSVLDAFNAFKIDQARSGAAERRTQAGEARKQAGARVARPTAGSGNNVPKGVKVGRVLDLNNLGSQWGA